MDPNLSTLLKWSTENSSATPNGVNTPPSASRSINPDALSALFGGPSDADLMKDSMAAILSTDPEISNSDKLVAFDNFEQLIENLENANNMAPLGLWTPLLGCLDSEEADIRRMAAWCIGTAVQNNETSQERCLAMGGVERLTALACSAEEGKDVRRKAIYALSSECRNYQPAMDVLIEQLSTLGRTQGKVDATDMDAADVVFGQLREEVAKLA